MTAPAPKGLRLHIGLFGRRNVGKSSLLNALVRQQVSIVSPVAGTTTDPVEKPMELLPVGPVLFIDTAGIDDEGALGALRVEKTRQALDRADVAVLVTETGVWGKFEEQLLADLETRKTPTIVVQNKTDVSPAMGEAVVVTPSPSDGTSAPAPKPVLFGESRRDSIIQPGVAPLLSTGAARNSIIGLSTQPLSSPPAKSGATLGNDGRNTSNPERVASTSHPPQLTALANNPVAFGNLGPRNLRIVRTSALTGSGLADLRQALLDSAPQDFIDSPAILGDLVGPGELAVLVVPIDKEAPKGRLILPQVQAIRDLLDSDACCLVVKERELRSALDRLKTPPKLVVTDSQAFLKVAADVPRSVPLTSFSILMSRFKGDLPAQVQGALAIEHLKRGDRVLVAESCSHHPIGEDIGRVKIPRWLTQYVGGKLEFDHVQGHDFPADLSPYRLVVHCGACMWNRREMLSRILRCRHSGVPITNYGLTIAYSLGIFERALEPFPAARDLLASNLKN